MEKEVKLRLSNRHVHLSKEVYELLFDEDIEILKPLNQLGQYVSNKTVTLKTKYYQKEDVKVLGPLRNYTQVEISKNDARMFKIDPPVRRSGDLEGAEEITISTEKSEITLPCCIIAERHVHIPPQMAKELELNDKDIVKIKIDGLKPGIVDAHVKCDETCSFEVHLDTDDGNAFLIQDGDMGMLIKE